MGFNRRRGRAGREDLAGTFFNDDAAGSHVGTDRKTQQVCREVWRVLSQIEVDDPRLAGFLVLEVRPAPDASRLLAVVQIAAGLEVAAAREALAHRRGSLRAEMAVALQRKRTPDLLFDVVPEGLA